MHGVVSRTVYYYSWSVLYTASMRSLSVINCTSLYIILVVVKAIIIIISMYLTLVGSLNLTVAIIDHQFTRSFITGLTKVRIRSVKYSSRKLYYIIMCKANFLLYMVFVVWAGLH